MQTSGSLSGITSGTLLGIFTLGMLFPWANEIGALIGGFVSVAFVGWMVIGTQIAITKKQIVYPVKPTSIEGCNNNTLNHYYKYLNETPTVIIADP